MRSGLIALLLAACSLWTLPAHAFDANSDFMFATGLFRKQRWEYAADAFERFLKDHPEHSRVPLARLYLGLSLSSLEKYEPARTQFETFVRNNPDSRNLADARYRIGESSFYLRDFDRAIRELTDYLKQHSGHNLNAWAQLMLGESHNALQQFAQAQTILTTLVNDSQAGNIEADARFALGVALQGQQQTAAAIQTFQQVVDLKSTAFSHRALARIGTIHFESGDFAKASAIYDQLVADYPDRSLVPAAKLQSGIAQFRLQQYAEALQRFESVAADANVYAQAQMWAGLSHREQQNYDAARESLQEAFRAAEDSSLAPEVLFHQAQVEALAQNKDLAVTMYADLATRWPQDRHAADSLFYAAELRIELGQPDAAATLLDRLKSEHPEFASRPEEQILRGRMLLSEGRADQAVQVLQAAEQQDLSPEQERLRRYHLVRALHQNRDFASAVQVFDSSAELQSADHPQLHGAIVLAAISSLETQQYQKAQQLADLYLKLQADGPQAADALAARAVAATLVQNMQQAESDLHLLTKQYPDNSQTWMAVLQSAEAAWQQENFETSARFFELATRRDSDPKLHLSALSGAAWSCYRQQNYGKAVAYFHQAHTTYPNAEAAVECRYMEAASLMEQDQSEQAQQLFAALFDELRQQAKENDEVLKNQYLLDSGRMQARLAVQQNDSQAADRAWQELASLFNDTDQLAEILDEWAYSQLQQENYARSDEIYQRLLDRFPNSPYAGQARLSLAESQMQKNRLDVALREFIDIAGNERYSDAEREAALYHAVDISAAQRDWPEVIRLGQQFTTAYSGSELAPYVQLLYAEGLLDQQRLKESREKLTTLKAAAEEGRLDDAWTDRIWIALAEVALAERSYEQIDTLGTELRQRSPMSKFLFQLNDVQGRRWKTQPTPDFQKSRDYLQKVVDDEIARGTETAARCQFLIGETWLLQKKYEEAVQAYYRVYVNYAYEDWQVRGLFQAAGCEEALSQIEAAAGNTDKALARRNAAIRSYQDVVSKYPDSELTDRAQIKLKQLQASSDSREP
jgi:TolA-binding protein